MPVIVDSSRSSHDCRGNPDRKPSSQLPERPCRCVTIGLINNMPEAAFKATERQFVSLLNAASEGIPVRLSLYALAGIPETKSSGSHAGSRYSGVETLWNTRLDGLIVTGREPMSPDLRDEPYWESFTKVLEWARGNTYSTVWSCLAAHAAILHMDGIGRRKSEEKYFGVFDCARVSSHRLMAGTPPSFQVPHSRWNGVAEKELTACGYGMLARTADKEIDTFVKEGDSLFVFFQGHPEYESDTLLREYRRDVGRYFRHEMNTYPSIPRGYFDQRTETTLVSLREKAISSRNKDVLASIGTALGKATIENPWHSTAVRIYRNWLEYIREQKNANLPRPVGAC